MSERRVTAVAEAEPVTATEVVAVPETRAGRARLAVTFAVAGLACVALGIWNGPGDSARFRLSTDGDAVTLPVVTLPATATAVLLGAVALALAGWHLVRGVERRWRPLAIGVVAFCFVMAFLVWATTGRDGTVLDLVGVLSTTIFLAVPLALGAMAGIVSERSGVVNVAIEGQMLAGAFAAALIGSVASNLGAGVVGGVLVGGLVGSLLAVFAIRFLINQVVLGVVINLLVLGLTNFLYGAVMQRDAVRLNSPGFFQPVRIPLLADIPVVGPLLFEASLLVYLAVLVVVVVQIALFRTKWGLRTRAVGEHPKAADTLGIDVNRLRFRNTVVSGMLAGLAGAYISIGTVGPFVQNMTNGRGFIALAAVIFGRWTPLGSVGAALLFAFCTGLQRILGIIGTPVAIPSQFLSMLPYLVTIFVVAGAIGRVRAPAASGVPYVKG